MLSLEEPSQGTVKFLDAPAVILILFSREKIYAAVQAYFFSKARFSALTYLIMLLYLYGYTHHEDIIRDLVTIKLDMVAMDPNMPIKCLQHLSGGMIKRVAWLVLSH